MRIDELTRRDLVSDVDSVTKGRARQIQGTPRYLGMTRDHVIKMQVNSATGSGDYIVSIKLVELPDLLPEENMDTREKIRLAIDGDLKINCTCPAFCLRGNVEVPTLDGKVQSVEDLLERYNRGDSLWVYSVDKEGDFHPGKISKVWVSGYRDEFIRVTLDNGETVETTPNHEFMMRDGTYKRASTLTVGQSLMPLYFNRADDGYLRYHKNSGYGGDSRGWSTVYKQVAEDVFSEGDHRDVTERCGETTHAIHHIDYDKKNDSPENLSLMGWKEHFSYHSKMLIDRWKNDPEFREKNLRGVRSHLERINSNPTEEMRESRKHWTKKGHVWCRENPEEHSRLTREGIMNRSLEDKRLASERKSASWDESRKAEASESFSKVISEYWSGVSPEERKRIGSKNYKNITEWESDATEEELKRVRLKRMRGRSREPLLRMISYGIQLTEDNYKIHKKRRDPHVKTIFDSFEEMLEYHGISSDLINHKVVKLETVKTSSVEPVYDISVEGYHNFRVSAGVILHNCYWGFEYITTQLDANSGEPQERFPEIRNPRLVGVMCKHCFKAVKSFGSYWSRFAADIDRGRYIE